MKSPYLKKTITHIIICKCFVYVTGHKRVQCSDYSGDNEVAFNITGNGVYIVVDNGVVYYNTVAPNR